jgi:hypothetical protein
MEKLDSQPLAVSLLETERQMVILALAHLAVENPSWYWPGCKVVEKLQGLESFETQRAQYQELLTDRLRLAVDIRNKKPRSWVPAL